MGLIVMVFLAACTQPVLRSTESKFETSQELKKFSNAAEILEYIQENQQNSNVYARGMFGGVMMDSDMVFAEAAEGMAVAKSAAPQAAGGADEFSTTNIQVEGVDEADFVKNDGKYIYVLSQDRLVIVEAYPADDAEIISKTDIEGNPRQIFLNDDRLVVFTTTDDEAYVIEQYDFIPRPRYAPRTHAFVYDISDREDPELVNDFTVNGNYFQSRMIGDYVYFISQDSVYYRNDFIDMPVVRADEKVIMPDVYYFDNPENNFVFHTVASFNVNDDDINAKSYLMGHSNTLYVSQDNIYISYQKNLPYRHYQEQSEERFFKVVLPLLPSSVQLKIKSGGSTAWVEISSILQDMYNNMDENDKEELIEEIAEAVNEYEANLEAERRKTVIHKLAIDRGDIDYVAKGEVNGYLLNQFSLDEYDENLRVATTTNLWTRRENVQYNNVFVLDSDMDVVGELEEIAPDERIYSTRFVGEKLYMVTFKRVDPLFVIDLSNPRNPKILGELKIPGYSDYLHPYDEDHIIGIGKETKENEWGGVSVQGVKLALFDVSDVDNPKMLDKIEIGDRGTDSEALRDHKAFLFDKKKNLLVIPIREVKETGTGRYSYRQKVWQGAYVLSVTPRDGFEVTGKVAHSSLEEEDYWYYSPYAVRRSLYMDDVLYTISHKKIVANDLDDLDKISEVKLPYSTARPIYY